MMHEPNTHNIACIVLLNLESMCRPAPRIPCRCRHPQAWVVPRIVCDSSLRMMQACSCELWTAAIVCVSRTCMVSPSWLVAWLRSGAFAVLQSGRRSWPPPWPAELRKPMPSLLHRPGQYAKLAQAICQAKDRWFLPAPHTKGHPSCGESPLP